jgi:hypothetical protein
VTAGGNVTFDAKKGRTNTVSGITLGWPNAANPADAKEAGQTLTYSITGVDLTKFLLPPTITGNQLRFALRPTVTVGTPVTFAVKVMDDGGTVTAGFPTLPGDNTSPNRSISINPQP